MGAGLVLVPFWTTPVGLTRVCPPKPAPALLFSATCPAASSFSLYPSPKLRVVPSGLALRAWS